MSTNPTTPSLILKLLGKATTLFQSEVRLARAEVAERVSTTTSALVMLSVSLVILTAAMVILLQAVVALLMTFGIRAHWAGLIVAVAMGSIGLLLIRKTVGELKSGDLALRRTMNQLHKDISLAKEQLK